MTVLFKKDVQGRTRIWHIEYDGDTIYISHGIEGGNLIEEEILIEEKGGRSLEEQAELEVNSRIKKKLDFGMVRNRADIGKVLKNQLGFKRQMKALLLKDGNTPDEIFSRMRNHSNFIWDKNCFVQRKYNGHRCTIARIEERTVAYSTGGKPITSISHILKDIKIKDGQEIDGELYVHGLSLQKISSKVRTENVTDKDLKFVIFDQMLDKPFRKRHNAIPKQNSIHIIMAETISVRTFAEVKRLFHKFRAEKYEGAMLRHGTCGYECGIRSKSILKIKKLDGEGYYDAEFRVTGVVASVEGWARLCCVTEKGKRFKVSAHGTHYEKREILENIENYVGRFVKVEFPEWTDSGKPSQPVAIMWRDCENE